MIFLLSRCLPKIKVRDERMLYPSLVFGYIERGIIIAIVQGGRGYISGLFVGNYSDLGRKFYVSRQVIKTSYKKGVDSRTRNWLKIPHT